MWNEQAVRLKHCSALWHFEVVSRLHEGSKKRVSRDVMQPKSERLDDICSFQSENSFIASGPPDDKWLKATNAETLQWKNFFPFILQPDESIRWTSAKTFRFISAFLSAIFSKSQPINLSRWVCGSFFASPPADKDEKLDFSGACLRVAFCSQAVWLELLDAEWKTHLQSFLKRLWLLKSKNDKNIWRSFNQRRAKVD